MRYQFTGTAEEVFPTLGLVCQPGDVIDVDEVDHPRLIPTDAPVVEPQPDPVPPAAETPEV